MLSKSATYYILSKLTKIHKICLLFKCHVLKMYDGEKYSSVQI
jgi:hypothetical protein